MRASRDGSVGSPSRQMVASIGSNARRPRSIWIGRFRLHLGRMRVSRSALVLGAPSGSMRGKMYLDSDILPANFCLSGPADGASFLVCASLAARRSPSR